MKLCKDCKHCNATGSTPLAWTCKRPSRSHLVTGSPLELGNRCVYERETSFIDSILFGGCGKEGKFWEAK
jgi:hypothetical protein